MTNEGHDKCIAMGVLYQDETMRVSMGQQRGINRQNVYYHVDNLVVYKNPINVASTISVLANTRLMISSCHFHAVMYATF